jgi:hypothetical protein
MWRVGGEGGRNEDRAGAVAVVVAHLPAKQLIQDCPEHFALQMCVKSRSHVTAV